MTIKVSSIPKRLLAALTITAALSMGGLLAAGASGASAQSITAQEQLSQNWSGYVVNSTTNRSFSNVSASWVEPTVASSETSGYSAYWVGLGGSSQQSQSLEQVGTAADTSGGQTSYYAWYELVPAAQQRLDLAIHPGDHMAGSVTVNGTAVTISLTDQTTGQSVTKTLQMNSPDTSSAEWIVEAPAAQTADGSYSILPLADFGSFTFTGASATADGHTGSISDPAWSVERVAMSPSAGGPVLGAGGRFSSAGAGVGQSGGGASTGAVSGDGSSFTVSYSSGASSQQTSGSAGGYGVPGGYGDPGYGYGGGDPYGGYGPYGYGGGGYAYGYPGGGYAYSYG